MMASCNVPEGWPRAGRIVPRDRSRPHLVRRRCLGPATPTSSAAGARYLGPGHTIPGDKLSPVHRASVLAAPHLRNSRAHI